MTTLHQFSLWLYHTIEMHICDVKLVYWRTYLEYYERKSRRYQERIDALSAR
jgi:hypothetical protein